MLFFTLNKELEGGDVNGDEDSELKTFAVQSPSHARVPAGRGQG